MRLIGTLTVAALAMFVTGPVSAQQTGAQGKVQEGVQGKGGAQVQGDMNFHGGNTQAPWFSDPGVRKQLNVSDEQFEKLN